MIAKHMPSNPSLCDRIKSWTHDDLDDSDTDSTTIASLDPEDKAQVVIDTSTFQELSERAAHLLKRDSVLIHNASTQYPSSHLLETSATGPLPVDKSCRTKMIEWAFRAIEHNQSVSCIYSTTPLGQIKEHREYSVGALRIVMLAFSYVDRVTSQNHEMLQYRSRYKLLCMISLHLAAKISGLFSYYYNDITLQEPTHHMLSFNGLLALSGAEFTTADLCHMELEILKELDWNLTLSGGSVFQWLEIFFTIVMHAGYDDMDGWNLVQAKTYEYLERAFKNDQFSSTSPSALALEAFCVSIKHHERTKGCKGIYSDTTFVLIEQVLGL